MYLQQPQATARSSSTTKTNPSTTAARLSSPKLHPKTSDGKRSKIRSVRSNSGGHIGEGHRGRIERAFVRADKRLGTVVGRYKCKAF